MDFIPYIVIAGCALIGSFTDVRDFKVYNVLTIPCFVAGVAFYTTTQGLPGLGYSLGGAILGFLILLLPYLLGGVGAGDVKFVMAIGAWLGPALLFPALLIGCLATGVYALVLMVTYGGASDAKLNVQLLFLRLAAFGKNLSLDDQFESVQEVKSSPEFRKRLIPFSAMFSVGLLGTALFYLLMQQWSS